MWTCWRANAAGLFQAQRRGLLRGHLPNRLTLSRRTQASLPFRSSAPAGAHLLFKPIQVVIGISPSAACRAGNSVRQNLKFLSRFIRPHRRPDSIREFKIGRLFDVVLADSRPTGSSPVATASSPERTTKKRLASEGKEDSSKRNSGVVKVRPDHPQPLPAADPASLCSSKCP